MHPTDKQKKQYMAFIKSIGHVLPDKESRNEFTQHLKKSSLSKNTFEDRATFSKWMHKFHSAISKECKSKCNVPTYSETRDVYENFRSRCLTSPTKKNIENGCTESLYGLKAKSVLQIVPKSCKKKNMRIDPKCVVKRGLGNKK